MTDDVRITNCTFADSIFACIGIGIGSETSGGIRNVRIEHCRFTHARTYTIYIKTRNGRERSSRISRPATSTSRGPKAGFSD